MHIRIARNEETGDYFCWVDGSFLYAMSQEEYEAMDAEANVSHQLKQVEYLREVWSKKHQAYLNSPLDPRD